MNRIYIPATQIADWQKLLAEPEKHWRAGFSAMAIAESWHHANGFPAAVSSVLKAAGEPLSSVTPLLIFPEHRVDLPPRGSRPSQNDVWVLARHDEGLASITVEGKVSEAFGPTVQEWQKSASEGKRERLDYLKGMLGLSRELPDALRYQLLHRTASAVIEAKRFRADTAVMLVQSFSGDDIGLQDYRAFAQLFGYDAPPDEVRRAATVDGITLYLGWVRDRSIQLTAAATT